MLATRRSLSGRNVYGELGLRIVRPDTVAVQEPPESRDLIRQIHDDNLHFDFVYQIELEDFLACFEGLTSGGDEHVSVESKVFQMVDEFAELCAPSQDAELERPR